MGFIDLKQWKKKGWYLGLLVLTVLGTASLYTYLAKQDSGFDPIEALPYEALMMEEDNSAVDLSSSNSEEISAFFSSHKDLNFTPFILNLPRDYKFTGASIIDYEFTKIAVSKFKNEDQSKLFFHFVFSGNINELTPGKRENFEKFFYQSYNSEDSHFIVWQHDSKTLSMLLGYVPTSELVQIATSH